MSEYFGWKKHPWNIRHRLELVPAKAFYQELPDISLKRALEISILKWEEIVRKLESEPQDLFDGSTNTCMLCRFCHDSCEECPVVMMGNGGFGCANTPYEKFIEVEFPESLANAREEIEFLKELLGKLEANDV